MTTLRHQNKPKYRTMEPVLRGGATIYSKLCATCDEEFLPLDSRPQMVDYCSTDCATLECLNCGEEFMAGEGLFNDYCKTKCASDAQQFGHEVRPETGSLNWKWSMVNFEWGGKVYGPAHEVIEKVNGTRIRDVVRIFRKDGESSKQIVVDISSPLLLDEASGDVPSDSAGMAMAYVMVRALPCLPKNKSGSPCKGKSFNDTGYCRRHQ